MTFNKEKNNLSVVPLEPIVEPAPGSVVATTPELVINLNGLKGIYTLDEVIDLLHDAGVKVKIEMHKNGTSHIVNGEDYRNSK